MAINGLGGFQPYFNFDEEGNKNNARPSQRKGIYEDQYDLDIRLNEKSRKNLPIGQTYDSNGCDDSDGGCCDTDGGGCDAIVKARDII